MTQLPNLSFSGALRSKKMRDTRRILEFSVENAEGADWLADGAVRFELVSRVNRLTVDEAVDT